MAKVGRPRKNPIEGQTNGIPEHYKKLIGKREEHIELVFRGEKQRKIAEWAEVIKLIGSGESLQIPQQDFESAYGVGKKGTNYVKAYLRKFGIPHPRVATSKDKVHIWTRTNIQ